MLRRAIEASRQDSASVPGHPPGRPSVVEEEGDDSFDDDDYMEIDDDEEEKAYLAKVMKEKQEHQQMLTNAGRTGTNSYARAASLATSAVPQAAIHRIRPAYQGLGLSGITSRVSDAPPVLPPFVGITGSNASHLEDARYYDDEDEMLQAALKASLEDAPVDFVVPEPSHIPEAREAASTSTPALSASSQPPVASSAPKTTAKPKDESEEEEGEEEEEEAPKPLTAEQLRAARLARFGG
jgi:ataxin-3